MRHLVGRILAGVFLSVVVGGVTLAQDAPAPAPSFSPQQLDQLVAPLALYPDPLVAEIMAAATYPDQVVLADRYASQGMSPDDVAQQGLDPSVSDLAHYPNLLKWLDDNLPWTTQLGQAFAGEQGDVMDAIQRMRAQAQNLGNLQNTPQETVVNDGDDIEIEPANPDDIYVPDYDADAIYYTPGIYCTFGVALPVGFWLGHDWDWHNHHLVTWTHNHPRPHDWWTRPPAGRHNIPGAQVWRPGGRAIYNGDRGYAKNYGGAREAAAPRSFNNRAFMPNTRAVIPNTRAVIPNTRAVIPDTHAIAPHVPPPGRTFVTPAAPPERSFAPPAAPPERGGVFGGAESARQTDAFSERGAESRGVSTPVSGGFHGGGGGGGGGGSRGGGGGGGGGGGSRGGGGGRGH
jgi:hypothetical protein